MCSPKRVSKKYEGTGYNGKQIYTKKQPNGFPQKPASNIPKQARLDILERHFLDALTDTKKFDLRGPHKAVQVNPVQRPYATTHASLRSALLQGGPIERPATTDTVRTSLQARSDDLSALLQERNRLHALLKGQLNSAPGVGGRNLQSSAAAAEMFVAANQTRSANDTLGALLEMERSKQAALASNLARRHMSLTATNIETSLLGASGRPAFLSGMVGERSREAHLTSLGQLPLESRLKRAMEVSIELRAKRARLSL